MTAGEQEAPDSFFIGRVLEGDKESFSVLVRRHQRRIYRLGLSFFRNGEEAADFAQDVFMKAYVGLAGFGGRSSFATWLTRIGYNTAINATRRTARYEPLEFDPEDDRELSIEDRHIRSETIEVMKKAMAALPERYAVCLDLYFYYDMKYEEISDVTGFPVNTIKSHVFRAKKDLRRAVEGDDA